MITSTLFHRGCARAAMIAAFSSLAISQAVAEPSFDPLSANPSDLALMVKTDEKLLLQPGDAVLTIRLDAPQKDKALNESFALDIAAEKKAAPQAISLNKGQKIYSAVITPADHARFEAALAKARQARQSAETAGKGSLSVGVKGGCSTGKIDPQKATLQGFLRIGNEGKIVPLMPETSLSQIYRKAGVATAAIPACNKG